MFRKVLDHFCDAIQIGCKPHTFLSRRVFGKVTAKRHTLHSSSAGEQMLIVFNGIGIKFDWNECKHGINQTFIRLHKTDRVRKKKEKVKVQREMTEKRKEYSMLS